MAITQAFCNQFKVDLFAGVHQPGDTYMIALYDDATATLDKTTTAYTATGEISGTGYVAGGAALTGFSVALTADTAHLSFDDPEWLASTITADGALIYNASRADGALAVLKFTNAPVSSTAGTFTVDLPAAGLSALLRIA